MFVFYSSDKWWNFWTVRRWTYVFSESKRFIGHLFFWLGLLISYNKMQSNPIEEMERSRTPQPEGRISPTFPHNLSKYFKDFLDFRHLRNTSGIFKNLGVFRIAVTISRSPGLIENIQNLSKSFYLTSLPCSCCIDLKSPTFKSVFSTCFLCV